MSYKLSSLIIICVIDTFTDVAKFEQCRHISGRHVSNTMLKCVFTDMWQTHLPVLPKSTEGWTHL